MPQVQEIDVLAAGPSAAGEPAAELVIAGNTPALPERAEWADGALERLTPTSHNYR